MKVHLPKLPTPKNLVVNFTPEELSLYLRSVMKMATILQQVLVTTPG